MKEAEIKERLDDARSFLSSASSSSADAAATLGVHSIGHLKYDTLGRILSLFYDRGVDFGKVESAFPSLFYALTKGIKLCSAFDDARRMEYAKFFEADINAIPIQRIVDIPVASDVSIDVPVLFPTDYSPTNGYVFPKFMRFNVRKVVLPVGLVEVGLSSFSGSSVEEVYIPSSVRRIVSGAFSLSRLRRVVFEEGGDYLNIYLYAFKNCPYLNEVVLPRHLRYIREDAFYDDPEVCEGVEVDFNVPKLIFQKPAREVLSMDGYPWGIAAGRIIRCADVDLVVGRA